MANLFNTHKKEEELLAEQLDAHANKVLDKMVKGYNLSMERFWSSDNPQGICDSWGTGAAERFIASGKLRNAINDIQQGASDYGDSLQGEFQANEDGTVTIVADQS